MTVLFLIIYIINYTESHTSQSGTEGSIRLAGGSTDNEGRLEVFTLGHWATVCSSSLGLEEATVVCRQLGFATALSVYRKAEFGPGSNLISLGIHSCTGYESNLTQCGYSIRSSSSQQTCHYYRADRAAGVNCAGAMNVQNLPLLRVICTTETLYVLMYTIICVVLRKTLYVDVKNDATNFFQMQLKYPQMQKALFDCWADQALMKG